ncbi:MAG: protein translocase subunit SecF [Firmicutes bacterium]|nr:protein translocase subunit SecF [Bacillota bacterium]MCL5040293.1 protein translocase subunit SecF [Bacillota bacterium]
MIDFMGKWKIWFTISGTLLLVGLISFFLQGLNLGIDFTGGTLLDLRFEKAPGTAEIRSVLNDFGLEKSVIQQSGAEGKDVLIRTVALSNEERVKLTGALGQKLGKVEVLRAEDVQPVIGRELTRLAVIASAIAVVGMIIYITLRFEFKFAMAGILALIHDVGITIGLVSLLRAEVGAPFVAAILTILGYSINDTIVIFDRTRELLRNRRKGESLAALSNRSVNQTLTRSIYTVSTTLFTVLAILIFGGKTIQDFALTLFIGITLGAYSSIFIASPLWLLWKEKEERAKKAAARA